MLHLGCRVINEASQMLYGHKIEEYILRLSRTSKSCETTE